MITLDFAWFAVLYTGAGLAMVFGLWLYYDLRDKRVYQEVRERATYHCVKCGTLYTDGREREVSACPRCGFENARLKF